MTPSTHMPKSGSLGNSLACGKGRSVRAFITAICLVGWCLGPAVPLLADRTRRPIIVGSDRNFPPYEYLDAQGQPAGFNIDLIRAVAEEAGLTIEIRPGAWSELRRDFDRGELDVLSGMFFTEERAKSIRFSVPHSMPQYAIFHRKDGPEIRSASELKNRVILVERGDIVFENLKAQGLHVAGVPSPEEALREVSEGQADCAVVLKSVGLYFVQRRRFQNIMTSGPPLYPQKYCFAIRRDDADLLSRINEALFIVKESGQYAELYARNFGVLESSELPFSAVLRRSLVVVVPILALLAAALGWTWSLRRIVHQRTLSLKQELLERRRTEAALKLSEARYRQLAEQNHDLILELDAQGRYRYVNPNVTALLGRSSSELIGCEALDPDILDQDDLASLKERWPAIATVGNRTSFDYRIQDHAGEWHWLEGRSSAFLDEAGETRVVLVSRDVTERRQTEAVLRQTQKLESLGILAGGIAHDFNNLLTAILGNLNLAQHSLAEGSRTAHYLDNIEKTVLKASALTRQMLAYSGKGRFIVKPIDLNQVIQEMLHLLQVSIPKKIALRYRLATALPLMEADPAQIQQVVMNLVTNASESIGDAEGAITISTLVQEVDSDYIATTFPSQSIIPGSYVVLVVEDTGCGMQPEIMARIFDPFFTTKASGRGLGLSAMLGILRGHKAGIKIYSEVGKGSVFKVFFLSTLRAAVPIQAEATAPPSAFTGTVLLVDDEPIIRETIATALGIMGFQVLTAPDGQEALELLEDEKNAIDLVIMDLTMPRMDGHEAFKAMRRRSPSLPIILCSGYAENEAIEDLQKQNLTAFLQKPYPLGELKKAIQIALSEPGG